MDVRVEGTGERVHEILEGIKGAGPVEVEEHVARKLGPDEMRRSYLERVEENVETMRLAVEWTA